MSLQSSNYNILGLAATVALFADEVRFSQIQAFFRVCSLQNEVGDPPFFFYISGINNSSSFNGKIFRPKSMLEKFRANVLKVARYSFLTARAHWFRNRAMARALKQLRESRAQHQHHHE